MRTATLFAPLLAAAWLPSTLAYPGMAKQLEQVKALAGRDEGDSTELLGDLLTLDDSQLSSVGRDIKQLLTGGGNPESNERYNNVPGKNTKECAKDTCCYWKYISDDMANLFRGKSGRCTKWARFAVRLGFHDAGTWTKQSAAQGGGADGSIVLAGEITRPENKGLEEIVQQMQKWYDQYKNKNGWPITMADLIQMGATVATVTCPLGPRVRSYVGRKDSSTPNIDGVMPGANQDAEALIKMFRDKTIGPHGLVALVGAHSTSQQRFFDTSRSLDPQDSTPGAWDVAFYPQTLGNAPARVFKFPSDISLSQHPATQGEWKEFAGPGGQDHWNEDFAREYIRLSLLGVNNINNLTECTKVLPPAIRSYGHPDQSFLDKWLSTKDQGTAAKEISKVVEAGDAIVQNLIDRLNQALGGIFGPILKFFGWRRV